MRSRAPSTRARLAARHAAALCARRRLQRLEARDRARDRAFRQQHHDQDQDRALDHQRIVALHGELLGEPEQHKRADHRGRQALAAGDGDPDHRQDVVLHAEDRGGDEALPRDVEDAGEPGEEGAEAEHAELDQADVVAQRLGALGVLADRDHHPACLGVHQPAQPQIDDHHEAEGEEVEGPRAAVELDVAAEAEVERRRLADDAGEAPEAVVAAEVGIADEPALACGLVEEGLEQQRHHQHQDGHVDAAQPGVEHDEAEHGGDRHRHREPDAERRPGVAVALDEVDPGDAVGVAAEAEKGALA